MAGIAIREASKVYPGGVEALSGISLEVANGELCVLVGPSGCGKSTLLRMVAGLESVTKGEISIGGRVVNELEPAERDIAMVFQNYALYPHMSVYDNMAYGLRNRRTPKPEIDARVREAARLLALEPFLDRKPRQLSGGQRQRVAMGRALVRKPQAFLFDEPLSNLDAKLRGQTRVEIRRLQRSTGVTSLYVTHDQLEAMTLADRLVVMNAGRIEQVGAPIEVYERPETVFVAGFIGAPTMNLLPLERTGDGRARGPSGLELEAPAANGKRLTLGLRPEHAEVAPDAPGGDGIGFPITVVLAEPVGSDTYVHALVGERRITDPAAAEPDFVLRLPGKAAPETGEVLRIAAPRERLHLFDAETGRRLAG